MLFHAKIENNCLQTLRRSMKWQVKEGGGGTPMYQYCKNLDRKKSITTLECTCFGELFVSDCSSTVESSEDKARLPEEATEVFWTLDNSSSSLQKFNVLPSHKTFQMFSIHELCNVNYKYFCFVHEKLKLFRK